MMGREFNANDYEMLSALGKPQPFGPAFSGHAHR
jgi:hypothetical protein